MGGDGRERIKTSLGLTEFQEEQENSEKKLK